MQIVINPMMSSAVTEIQASRVALHTIIKARTELRNDSIDNKLTVHEVGYPEELDMNEGFSCTVRRLFKQSICNI